jgi:adenylyltransferase/sulfurtransferase
VFNYNNGPSYLDLFDELPEETTGNLGVVGALPGIIGSMQASETIKIITGIGEVLSGRLLVFNILKASFNEFEF